MGRDPVDHGRRTAEIGEQTSLDTLALGLGLGP
jgi:hypothetical protein